QCQTPISVRSDWAAAHSSSQRDFQSRYVPRQKRILMVAPGLARDGAERQMLATADGLVQRGYQVQVFFFTDLLGEPDFISEFSQLGVSCHHWREFGSSIGDGDNIEDIHHLNQFVDLVDQLENSSAGSSFSQGNPRISP